MLRVTASPIYGSWLIILLMKTDEELVVDNKTMASISEEIKPSEIEIELTESIDSLGTLEGKDAETLKRSDREKEVEDELKVGGKMQSFINTLKAKWLAIKKAFEDQLLQYGFYGRLDGIRAYQVWPGKNVFFFHGRLVCGPDPRGLMLTIVSIVLSSWIFARYVGKDFPHHPALIVTFPVILTLIVLLNLILVSAIDPGIIPRNDGESSEEDGIRSKKVIINGVELKVKYCRVCKIFRPPRSCHCAICDNCVERFDHHSPWIGQCVALRNYRFYMTFLMLSLIFFLYISAFSCWRLHQTTLNNGARFAGLLNTCPETLALAAFGLTASGFLGTLAIYHVYLTAINETAYENFRQRFVGSKNPYDKGTLRNFMEALFVTLPPSRVDFRAEVTPRPELVARGRGGRSLSVTHY